ncbi:S8 family serine peptidase [Schinkia azotoformans]|uniref:S8 family serine peptidase n=1 Tax=Schinkia azotoformans TaxID=1454 RepID=UPI002DBD3B9A|nr:S8 family serine peptidase [Schinkia azotoformans]MEC1743973.1 S8 family serine peptidase [Schinkia azotoformans]
MLKTIISLTLVNLLLSSQLTHTYAHQIHTNVPKIKPIKINVTPPEKNQSKKFIIEVEDQEVLKKIKANYPNVKLDKVFDTVLQGASIVGTEEDIEKIKRQPGIKEVHHTSTYKVELDQSVPFIGGMLLRGEFDEKGRRLTGKGVKVGVIDTGIDYTHGDLQRNYQGGFDLVDEDEDPMETVKSQGEATLHGSHVAGIIGANGKYLGVAPDAEIYAYRALGPGGVGTSDQVIAAIEKAVEDGMDIINLSLGSSVNGPDYPTSMALDKAVEKGVIAVTSNGNSGPGLWTVGSPGTSEKAISVGASTPPLEIPVLELELVPNKTFILQPLQGSVPWNLTKSHKIVFGGLGYPTEFPDVKDKIVLIERGEISFTEKVNNAYKKGAKAVLIFNNEEGAFSGGLEEAITIPVVALTREDGLFIKNELEKGHEWAETKMRKVQDQLANFSSRGPVTHTWGIKPDVVAPGVKIKSTIPNGYISLQGTSMAAPHVAGAAALIKQAHPDWNPEQVKAALMNTAKPIFDDVGRMYNPYEQGAGRIQVEKAVNAKVLAYPGSLAFGSIVPNSGMIEKSVKITLENKSSQTEKISFATPNLKEGVHWRLPLSFSLKPLEKRIVTVAVTVDSNKITDGIHYGNVKVESSSDVEILLPYLFVVGDADHPRVMGFSFEKENGADDVYKYELYLPEGAEELGVALFDPLTLTYVGHLVQERNVNRGLLEAELKRDDIPFADGDYICIVYAIQNGKEGVQQSRITIGEGK